MNDRTKTSPSPGCMARHDARPAIWATSPAPVSYEQAHAFMENHAEKIRQDEVGELFWLLEHPPLYTAGTSAQESDLRQPQFPVFDAGRGGQYTYHGPGQRVIYIMLDLSARRKDLRLFVSCLEQAIIDALASFSIKGERRDDRVGVWVNRTRPGGQFKEDKIAALGVRVRKWVSYHGVSVNVEPDLSHFDGVVPCGISDPQLGVTSLVDLGLPITMSEVDDALRQSFTTYFGPIAPAPFSYF